MGEPFAARTEMAGTGRVLFLTKDEWPDFISCVVAVREDGSALVTREVGWVSAPAAAKRLV